MHMQKDMWPRLVTRMAHTSKKRHMKKTVPYNSKTSTDQNFGRKPLATFHPCTARHFPIYSYLELEQLVGVGAIRIAITIFLVLFIDTL